MWHDLDLCRDEIKFAFEAGVLAVVALASFGVLAYCELKSWTRGSYV